MVNAPWVADGLNANERQTIAVIGDAAREDVSEARRLLEFPEIPTTDSGGDSYPFDFLRHVYLDSFNEEFPELASVLYSFPGFGDGGYRILIQTVSSLLRIARQDEEMARVVLEWPWVADGVTSDERDSLLRISRVIDLEPSLARLVLDFPWIADGINDVEQQALNMGWQVAGNDPEQARLLFRQGWFQDGVSEEEAALLIALKSASSWTSFSNELIETGQVQSQLIALPSGDVKVFVVSRSSLEEAAEHVFRGLGEGIEAIEHFMGAPWARAKVIVYLEPELQYIIEVAGLNAGSHIVIRGVSEREWRNYVIYHELAHFYFGYRNSPKWLAEGGANFLEAYTLHFGGGLAMEDLYQYARRGVAWSCLPQGITRVNDWNEATAGLSGSEYHGSPFWSCTYPIGETFLLGMYDSLGHATVEAALRALYRRGERSFRPASEDDVYTIFLRNTPAEDRKAFDDTYFCLHGREMPGLARSPACEVYTPIPTPVHRAELEIFTPITPIPTPAATPMPAPSATPQVLDRGMAADRAALVAFYHATGGRDWANNSGWLTGAPLDEWHGIDTDSNGRVLGIQLIENSLTGPLPGELANLANLRRLDLRNVLYSCTLEKGCEATSPSANRLTGQIPVELGRLTNLEHLNLAINQLTGEIPSALADLVNLRLLELGVNQLTGEIPPWLGNMVNLQGLHLAANDFSGNVPAQLGNLSNLTNLQLGHNRLTGPIPASLGKLTGLEYLLLHDNQLVGDIPSELRSLTNLKYLWLLNNQLTGPIPAWLGDFPNLEELLLSDNQLTGSIPMSLGNLSKLKRLYLPGDQLSGCIPAALRRLSDEQLGHPGLPFCGALIAPDAGSPASDRNSLIALYNAEDGPNWVFNTNWLSDAPLATWDGVKTDPHWRVTHLRLPKNGLTGRLPAELSHLTELEELFIVDNSLTGPIPSQLGNLSNLKVLFLGETQLTGPIPPELGNLSELEYFELSSNRLTGFIPPELGNLHRLQGLVLAENQLAGPLPPQLGNLTRLEGLVLVENQLTGEVPPELSRLTKLEHLYLAGNRFTGCIPAGLLNVSNSDLDQLGLPDC